MISLLIYKFNQHISIREYLVKHNLIHLVYYKMQRTHTNFVTSRNFVPLMEIHHCQKPLEKGGILFSCSEIS